MGGRESDEGEDFNLFESPHGWVNEAPEAAPLHLDPQDHERLDLDDHSRLPWLEEDGDVEYFEKSSRWRMVLTALAALLALGAVVGGVWWATHRRDAGAIVADGSTINPPSADYKQPPANPGGKTFQGTGDTSYVVSQGHQNEERLADSPPPSGPAPAAPAASASATGDAPAPAGGVVQIGAFSTQALAEAGWSHLSAQHPLLSQQHHRIVQGQADIGTVWRLQVITGAGGGNALCQKLRGEGLTCQVKH